MLINIRQLANRYRFPCGSVLHIGASTAEELTCYREAGFSKFMWVEPDHRVIDELRQRLASAPPSEHHRLVGHAAGHSTTKIDFYPASNQQSSSSCLPPELHRELYPDIAFNEPDRYQVYCLRTEELITRDGELNFKVDFLNIDVQGFELSVLIGLGVRLADIPAVYVEVNTAELYRGCAKLWELDRYLAAFDFVRLDTVMTDAHWGDAFYLQRDRLPGRTTP